MTKRLCCVHLGPAGESMSYATMVIRILSKRRIGIGYQVLGGVDFGSGP
jgi:hypothetical protein